ncbi:MAG: hypothetical protein ACTSQE_06940 [Candidatus Heimdallarchaeaceae archaeon]
MKEETIITSKNIEETLRDVIKSLNKPQPFQDYVWIESRKWYESEICKELWGFNPTKKELNWAEKTNGYIRRKRGFRLYLSKHLLSKYLHD